MKSKMDLEYPRRWREYELDDNMRRTGRWRWAQFLPTPRRHAVPPSKRGDAPWLAPSEGEKR